MRTDGQTDITKLAVAFRSFANSRKNSILYVNTVFMRFYGSQNKKLFPCDIY